MIAPHASRAEELVSRLSLAPHPEGGFYREFFRDEVRVVHPRTGKPRPASTCIFFLLPAGTFSAFHRVASAELWHHLEGDPLELVMLDESRGTLIRVRLGKDLDAGESPQLVVPAGMWQAALPLGEAYCLSGCTVAPGFEFADFELAKRQDLLAQFPSEREFIERLTRA
jgi:hypothetical protein